MTPRRLALLTILSLGIGAALRLVLPGVIEYKGDERWTFEMVQYVHATGQWPMVGMPSGVQLVNPGMSIWIFVVLGKLFQVTNPVELTRAVQLTNIAAIATGVIYVLWRVRGAYREQWLWAMSFLAVSPIAMIYHRKIWAQSILPIFCILALIGWKNRTTRAGAVTWGFFGAILGQIHMSGFFFSASVFLLTLRKRGVAWGAWLTGSVVGTAFMIPWFQQLLAGRAERVPFSWQEVIPWNFCRHWVADAFGVGLKTFLGHSQSAEFLSTNWIAGAAWVGLVACAVVILLLGRRQIIPRGADDTSTLIRAALLGGVLMSLSGAVVHRHYLIVTTPVEWLWLAGLGLAAGLWGRKLLTAAWVFQLITSILLLGYLNSHHGAHTGDFGVAYEWQEQNRH